MRILYMTSPRKRPAEILFKKIEEIKEIATGMTLGDILDKAFVELGSQEQFEGFSVCHWCENLYDGFESGGTDPDRDFCEIECESEFLRIEKPEMYNGDLQVFR